MNQIQKRKRSNNFSNRSLEVMFKAVFENWTQYNQHKGLKTNGKTPRQQLFDKILRELAEIGEEPEKTLEQIKKRIKDDIWRMKAMNTLFAKKFSDYQSEKTKIYIPTAKKYSEIVKMIELLPENGKKLKRTRIERNITKRFSIRYEFQQPILYIQRTNEKDLPRKVVKKEELFDLLMKTHVDLGHAGRDTMWRSLRDFHGISKEIITMFIKLCEECAQKKAGQGIEPFELRQGTVKAGPLNLDSIIKRKGNGEEWNGTYRKTAVPYYLGEMEKLLWNEDQSLIEDQPATSSLLENSIDQGSGTSIEAILGSLKGDTREIPSDENTAWLDLKPPILTEAPELRNVEQFFRASSSVSFENSIQSEARNNIKSNHDEEKCEFEMKRLRKENEDLQEEYDGLKQRAYYQMGAHQDQILRLEAQVRELKKEIKRLNGFQQSKQL